MSFEQDYLSGCKKFEKSFHNFCEKIFPVLGKVTQCGIIEFDKNGYGSVVANRVDFAEAYLEKKTYKLNRAYTFSEQVDGQFITYCSRPLMRKIHSKTELFYEKEFDVGNGFYYIEKIDDGDAYRHYFFGSDDQEIYTHLVNNSARVKKFIKYIQDSDEDIFRYCKDSKFKFSGEFPDYFKESKKQIEDERRKKLIIFLKNTGKLDKYKNISKRELQCFELYNQGKSARETGEI
ncbi:MAG: hypothetical protein HRT69_18685, partial [Flavobacteriaceae bacterium]|nr:hypothetical protein [Flavobacteriaceae bacterium]